MKVILISREDASRDLGRPHPNKARNYELESDLQQNHRDSLLPGNTEEIEYVISEWCPFNGIRCSYFEHATKKDLWTALGNHQTAVANGHMHPRVLDDIRGKLRGKA